ncbi:hypothetical protein T484DRAFT_2659255 [Baffinella frigidus]|nr:hypothetical protein T484DRAFT_2659255 [Cryptophyta sp. CCMP2293]
MACRQECLLPTFRRGLRFGRCCSVALTRGPTSSVARRPTLYFPGKLRIVCQLQNDPPPAAHTTLPPSVAPSTTASQPAPTCSTPSPGSLTPLLLQCDSYSSQWSSGLFLMVQVAYAFWLSRRRARFPLSGSAPTPPGGRPRTRKRRRSEERTREANTRGAAGAAARTLTRATDGAHANAV